MLIQKNDKVELDITQCNLRGKIQALMEEKGWKQKDLEQATGIHKTTLSKMMKGERQISLEHLDVITDVIGLSKGALYYDFVSECVDENGKYKVAKCEDFIISCYEAHLPELAKAITDALLNQDIKNNKDIILRISDKLYEKKMFDYALALYDEIIKEEQKKSAKLAVCYFRKFMILRDQDLQGKGREALFRLLDYLPILPDEYTEVNEQKYNVKLDAYYRVLTFFNVMEEWDNLLNYALELESAAIGNKDDHYLGESLIYQGYAYRGMGKYNESLETIKRYSTINDYFKNIAEGNRYYVLIEMGDCTAISDYINWALSQTPNNLYYVLPLAIECYTKHKMYTQAHQFINKNKNIMDTFIDSDFMLNKKCTLRLMAALGQLCTESGLYSDAIDYAIKCMSLASQMGQMKRFKEGTMIMYKNFQYINESQRRLYEMVLERR